MKRSLSDWNSIFENKFFSIEDSTRVKAGSLLEVIPTRGDWRDFLECIKNEWASWQGDSRFPFCLLVIYGGNAFYEYKSGQFWKPFTEAIETELNGNHQQKLNENFARVVSENGLKLFQSDFVGSAVFHIGVALHSWQHFLQICKWALRRDEWKMLSDAEWQSEIERRAGNQVLLKNFLLDNREAAADFIQTILDARKLLHEKPDLPFNELPQRNLLRSEYFDEVPETAEFLFPENSKALESLLESSPYLFWHKERERIELHLPAIPRDQLENACWHIGELNQHASANSDTLEINGLAFQKDLHLTLRTNERTESKFLRGLVPFGIYDGRRFINPERDTLPLQSHTIISQEKLEAFSPKDFDEEENCPNELYELKDGTNCYITRLDPIGKTPQVSFSIDGKSFHFRFKRSAKIEAYFFYGEGACAAQFSRYGEVVKTENLPLICVALPHEVNNFPFLQKNFEISLDKAEELRVLGQWEKRHEDESREYFVWKWAQKPLGKQFETQSFHNLTDLAELQENFELPKLSGKHTVRVKSEVLGLDFAQRLEILKTKFDSNKCWQNLPSVFLPFFLLCQKSDGMSWNEMLLAKDAIASDGRNFSESLLKKYAKFGLLKNEKSAWHIVESRAVIENDKLKFCGSPTILWTMFRYLSEKLPNQELPFIEVSNKRGELPYLYLSLSNGLWGLVCKYLENQKVKIVADLWES